MYPRDEDPSYGIFVAEQVRSLRETGTDVDLYYIKGYKNQMAYLRALADLRARRQEYDLFHAHHAYTGLAARLAGVKPLVVTIHEGAVISRPRYRAFARRVGARATRRIAVSPALARALAPLACDVIPIGIDLALFHPRDRFDARHELGLAADRKYILFAANPARPEKRFDLAHAAAAILNRSHPAVELISLPPSNRAQVAAYYGAADCVLVTSDFESGPLTVKEAIAAGRPVVSRRVGDVDFLETCPGCVIAGDSPEAIAQSIQTALAIKDIPAHAVAPYELETVARRLLTLYAEVVAAGKVARAG